jgi:hypothetical protein
VSDGTSLPKDVSLEPNVLVDLEAMEEGSYSEFGGLLCLHENLYFCNESNLECILFNLVLRRCKQHRSGTSTSASLKNQNKRILMTSGRWPIPK